MHQFYVLKVKIIIFFFKRVCLRW